VTPSCRKAVLSSLGQMNPWWVQVGEHGDLRKRVPVSFRLKDTITTTDSESYDSIGGHKHSLDQDTRGEIIDADSRALMALGNRYVYGRDETWAKARLAKID